MSNRAARAGAAARRAAADRTRSPRESRPPRRPTPVAEPTGARARPRRSSSRRCRRTRSSTCAASGTTPATRAEAPVAETNALSVSSARRIAAREPRYDRQHRPVPEPGSRSGRRGAGLCRRPTAPDTRPPAGARPSSPARARPRSPASRRGVAQSRLTPAAERLDDPWLRGLVLAPSVQNSLVVTQVGDPDFAGLAQFMKKPGSSVLMTFSSDPHLGMTDEQFTGSRGGVPRHGDVRPLAAHREPAISQVPDIPSGLTPRPRARNPAGLTPGLGKAFPNQKSSHWGRLP